ncbi:hypothetical protein M513_11273 [Trichuris suis]|uniref:Uncharacterized protein n=1 Tax=Trichuris suis TaxID=68888 RepID=A0A085LSB3_9BILA|nr:hypothetical protein M513_11273 [Trichuris suis]
MDQWLPIKWLPLDQPTMAAVTEAFVPPPFLFKRPIPNAPYQSNGKTSAAQAMDCSSSVESKSANQLVRLKRKIFAIGLKEPFPNMSSNTE